MRVLLIWPRNEPAILDHALSCCEPLSLEYLAGALRSHHDVLIHDLRLDPPLDTLVGQEPPGLVGLAIPYTTTVRAARQVAREIKRLWPDVPLVIGGHHPTVSSGWLGGLAADYVIAGEGGLALRYLADQLELGARVGQFPALAPFGPSYRDCVQFPALTSLDELPSPDRSLLERHHQHYFHSVYRPVALARFSAGCPYACSFCVLWRLTGQRYLTHSIPRILADLQAIEVENVYVVDDEAFIQARRMRQLAADIANSGIRKRYHMYIRTDTALRHPDVMAQWAEIGLNSVLMGAEATTNEELAVYKKGTNAAQTRAAVRLFQSLGVKVRTNFIIQPGYTEVDFRRVEQVVKELGIDLPTFAILTPLPGTRFFQETRSHFISENPDLFDCYHTLLATRLPLDRFYDAFAHLLGNVAGRANRLGSTSPGVFYYSSDDAFGRMLAAIRQGAQRHTEADNVLELDGGWDEI